ncbi:MAG: bifunctional 4-hydroxy-2-oxoglutarate aldolase/2-dehydro-3-deoxy-phosphogluconate aldolase [Melioribacteraceae bacterium]|nr:bifunctional 4-hydroxy-2-oxoglutarate aldolase/2-dehydro-3-deoxy-phosphogluconate aldolase [Melioribacteraceae bacterium]
MERNKILIDVLNNKAFAVVRLNAPEKVVPTVEAIISGGIKNIELTLTTPDAYNVLRNLVNEFGDESVIGVGSVLSAEQVKRCADIGAKYIVSPVYKSEIVEEAHKFSIPAMPGAFTPTEILTAFEKGADVVKVFPADVLGMAFFKGVLAPMPHLKIMPTGGVTLTNAGDWFKAGACAVGVGSALLDKNAIEKDDYRKIEANAVTLMNSIREYENNSKKRSN